jgi:group II intron reverse transcriptase/maturase
LHAKAKEHPSYRFYSLYDKLYRADILSYAYERCRSNGGVAGVDGESFEQIECTGREAWLGQLAERLRAKSYRAQAVRRVYIPKPNGKQRPLGIPTIGDRVVQMAAVVVLEPIFEADLLDEQYAYRNGRSAHDAVRATHRAINQGLREVVDADLSGYFDTIPHSELIRCLARRISDGEMLKLLKSWLKQPVEETDRRGRKRRSNPGKRTGRGTPQGAPISPLLSSLYMRRFILGWKQLGYEQRYGGQIVNYADDLVILCRHGADEALQAMVHLMGRLRLIVNEEKTSVRSVPRESFEFLSYTFGRCYSTRTGRPYLGTRPSRNSITQIVRQISEHTERRTMHKDPEQIVAALNHLLRGWGNYFSLGPVSKAYRAVDTHARYRLRQWLRGKHKVQGAGTAWFPDEYLYGPLGLIRLESTTRNLPWAQA